MNQHPLLKITIKYLPYVFYILLIYFLIMYIKNIDFVTLGSIHIEWKFIFIASLFGLAVRFWQVVVWFALLRNLGAQNLGTHRFQLAYVYAKSWLGRYIPGAAPWIIGKIHFASKHGIAKSKLAVSSLLEGALQVTVVLGVAITLLLFDSRLGAINPILKRSMIALFAICIIAVWPPLFNRLVSTAYRLLRRQTMLKENLASNKTVLQGVILYIIGAFLSGTALFFIAKAVYPALSYADIFYVMGVSNLAGALGMLAIFAPSGLGVREGILLTLLGLIMPVEYALAITVVSRLWDVAMDGIFFGSTRLALVARKQRQDIQNI